MQSVQLEKIEKIEPPPKEGYLSRLSSSNSRISRYLVRIASVLYCAKRNERGTPSLDKGLAGFRTRKRPSRLRCFPSQVASTASNTPLNPKLRSIERHIGQIYLKSGCSRSGRSSAHYGSLHTKFIFKSIECGLSTLPVLLQCRRLSLCEDHLA